MEECWNFQPKERPTFKYCLSELEELKNTCNLDLNLTNLNYTTLLPTIGKCLGLLTRLSFEVKNHRLNYFEYSR